MRKTRFVPRHGARAAGCLLLLLASVAALAQQRPVDQDAQQRPVDQDAQQRVEVIGIAPIPGLDLPRDWLPSNVQTAKAAEIDRSHALDLSGFMNRKLTSVFINEVQNNPFQPDLNYRGFSASPLLGSAQGLSVYLDGVRLNQPFGDVVSWDLIPKSAIASLALMPGSNPLFGLNTLGGALAIQTKDGLKNAGSSVQLLGGSMGRAALEFESGGSQAGGRVGGADGGLDWFVSGNRFHEQGWRAHSPSEVQQLFGKLGLSRGDTRIALSVALADNDLNGNGLQEQRLLAQDRRSVYSQPDNTRNRSALFNLAASQLLGGGLSLSGNLYWRQIQTATLNGDVNDEALGQALYQGGENAANTPFPAASCIASARLRTEPAERCNGLINRSNTRQRQAGLSGQLNGEGRWAGLPHQWLAGAALEASQVHFTQGSELGTLTPDHGISGVGAFGDGVTGGSVDGAPYDTRVDLAARTRTASLFASDMLALSPRSHLTLSGRWNRTVVRNRDAITPGGGAGSLDGDAVFSRLNPAIGLTFAASPGLTTYAGYNQGSRAPSAIELGCADPANPCKLPNAMAGDPPLRQVVTRTLEAGLRGSAGATVWNLAVFRADNHDDILFVADNAAGFGYFKNFGQTRRQGLEAGVSTRLAGAASGTTLGANVTWLDATFRSQEQVNGSGNSTNDQAMAGFPGGDGNIAIRPGDRLPLVPRQLLKLFVEWPLAPALSLGADVTAVAGSLARGNENGAHQADGTHYLGPGRSAGYAVLNLSGDWRPQWPAMRGLTLFVQVNNLLDRRYNTAAQLGATAFDASGRFVAQPFAANANGDRPLLNSTFYAPGAPRSLYFGMRYTFD
jgi:outer membrane receptor protein involved in Fe transport